MKPKRVTIRDIAEKLDLDTSTVSRALNKSPRVKLATQKLVLDCAAEMGYQQNVIASGLRTGRSNILGVLIPRIERSFFAKAIAGIEKLAAKEGCHVMISQSNEKYESEVDNINTFLKTQVDGIIMSLSVETRDFTFLKECQKKTPIIFFDRVADIDTDKVILNDFKGAYDATSHLIESGARVIMHLGGPVHTNIYKARREGYRKALTDHGLEVDGKLIHTNVLTREKGFEVVKKMLADEAGLPDAIFASSDFSALGAMECLKEHCVSVPGEIMVCGFGNEPFTSLMSPSMTSVEQYSGLMGHTAASLFFEKINDVQHEPRISTIEPKLIARESTQRIADLIIKQ